MIVLDDDKPEIVAKLVNFFYNQVLDLSVTHGGGTKKSDDDPLLVIARVCSSLVTTV